MRIGDLPEPRRAGASPLELGDFRFDVQRRELHLGAERLPLTRLQFKLLTCLVERSGEVVSYELLRARVWRGNAVTPGAMAQAALVLRRILQRSVRLPLSLVTVRGVGWRLDGALTRLPVSARAASGPSSGPEDMVRLHVLPVVNAVGADQEFSLPGVLQLLADSLRVPERIEPLIGSAPVTLPGRRAFVLKLRLGQHGDRLSLDASVLPAERVPQPTLYTVSVLGVDLLDMVRRLARLLRNALLRDDIGSNQPLLPWRDDWANLTYARAIALFDQQDYRGALPLLRALDQCATPHVRVQLALLRALAMESPSEVPERARSLIRVQGLPADALALAHALAALTQDEAPTSTAEPGPNARAAAFHLAQAAASELTLQTRRVLVLLAWKQFERQGCPPQGTAALLDDYGRIATEARLLGQPVAEAIALAGAGSLQITSGQLLEARKSLSQAIDLYEDSSTPVAAAMEHTLLAMTHWAMGELPDAVEECLKALKGLDGHAPQRRRVLALSGAALPLFDMRHDLLVARLQAVLAAWRDDSHYSVHPTLAAVRAVLLYDQGHPGKALDLIKELLAAPEQPYAPIIFLRQWGQVALRLAMALGREHEVRTYLQAQPGWAAMNLCEEFQRTVAHAALSERVRDGQVRALQQRLRDISGLSRRVPTTRAQCLATLDLAWLSLASLDLHTVSQCMTALGDRFSRNPLGMATRAHLLMQQRRDFEADALLEAAKALWGRGPVAWWQAPNRAGGLLSAQLLAAG